MAEDPNIAVIKALVWGPVYDSSCAAAVTIAEELNAIAFKLAERDQKISELRAVIVAMGELLPDRWPEAIDIGVKADLDCDEMACAYTPAVACYATMATPPEDDFPTERTCPMGSSACKCTDEPHQRLLDQIKAERDRSGVAVQGAVVAESGRVRPRRDFDNDRVLSGASTMTVEIEPGGRRVGQGCCVSHMSDPVVVEPSGSRPSGFNVTQKGTPEYEAVEARRRRGAAWPWPTLKPSEDELKTRRDTHYALDRLYGLTDTPTYINIARVGESFAQIGPRAQSLLVKIAERLAHGARQYGDFPADKPRDWNKEALEEHMDAVVYMAMACMERDEAKAADKARAEAACRGPATAMPPIDMRHYPDEDPREGAAPTAKPIIEGFHTPVSVCGCFVCTPPERPDWEKTRDGCG